jgi:hypothetical protein
VLPYSGIGGLFSATINLCGAYNGTCGQDCNMNWWIYDQPGCGGGPQVALYVGRCCCEAQLVIGFGFLGGGNGVACSCSNTMVSTSVSCGACSPSGTVTKI